MNRTELKRIVEDIIMTDPWTSSLEDYQHFTLEECREQLDSIRKENRNLDLEPEDRIPDELTAEELKKLWDEIVDEKWVKPRNKIRKYLLGEGNYDFPFNKYLESVREKTGKEPHPWVIFKEYFFDEPTDAFGKKLTYEQFALLVKNSPNYNPEDPFFWYEDGKLHSAKNIYPDIYNVNTVVDWIVENFDDLDYNDDIHAILYGEDNDEEED